MKLSQLIEYSKSNILRKNHAENEAERLVSDLILFFKKALHKVKANGLQLGFIIFR